MSFRNLDIGLLRTFVAVAEKENFAMAAEKVFRTQPAVSQQMQKLEAMLGCTLFERVGRSKRLTTEGSRFLDYARRIVGLNDEAYRAMIQKSFEKPVKIGACADAVDSLIPGYLEMCAETFPGLRVDIQVGPVRCLDCGGILKSDTISFGQALVPQVIDRAFEVATQCDLLLAVGSTLQVYPVAGVVPQAHRAGARVVIVNAEPTALDDEADAVLRGSISELLPAVCGVRPSASGAAAARA